MAQRCALIATVVRALDSGPAATPLAEKNHHYTPFAEAHDEPLNEHTREIAVRWRQVETQQVA